jgi:ABC-type polysaccharide/polyol phosphate export permease
MISQAKLQSGFQEFLSLPLTFAKDVFAYREYLIQSVARDLRRRYKRSVLGYCWSMLNPLFMMIILAIVFSSIMRQNIDDYAVFLFSGMLPWSYFSGMCNHCLNTIRSNAKILNQVNVPRYIFPVSVGFSAIADFILSVVPLILVMVFVGRTVPGTVLLLPMVLLPLFMVSMGFALVLAVANVFFEDTEHLVSVFLRALYFMSPVLYRLEQLPEWLRPWVKWGNPMYASITIHRDILYYGNMPSFLMYSWTLLVSFLILVFGLWVFKRSEDKFVFYL